MSHDLQLQYAMRFERTEKYRLAVWKVLTREFFSRWIRKGWVVLDLGCGWGEFINQIDAARKYGMDLNPDSARRLAPDVTFLPQDCSQPWMLPDEHLDVVFTSNFLEHLPSKQSLRQTLDQAFRCLKPNGRLICLGPNIKFLHGSYWDFWDHYLALTEASLGEVLRLTGFVIDLATGRFLPYSMSRGFAPPPVFLRLYLKCPFLWRFFGKQFLVVSRKPGNEPARDHTDRRIPLETSVPQPAATNKSAVIDEQITDAETKTFSYVKRIFDSPAGSRTKILITLFWRLKA
jgi:SAM-dependent methyltransferase